MILKNKNIMEGMRVTNGKYKLKVISWDKSYSDCLLNYLDSKGNRYVIAQSYELSGTEKDPQISWMNGRYFTANSDDEALEEYLDYLGEVNEYDISESLKESTKKHLVKGLDVDFVVDHLLSLEDPDDFDLINKLRDLWEVYNKSWNKFNNFLSDFWKVMKNIEKLDSFDKTCKEIIDAWYDDIEKIFYSDDNPENFKLNYGFRGNDVFESKKSIKEEIDRPTWSKWVVKYVHHVEYFFNGKIVDKKMLNSLFESEGFDTDVDAVEDEIKKAVRSVKLGNLDGNALHIAHNSVGNRIDLVFDIGGLLGSVESLSNDECVIRINGDIYEQDEMWNFGFAIYLTCDIYPLDFSLAESKRKPSRKSLKEEMDTSVVGTNKDKTKKYAYDFLKEWYENIVVESLMNDDGDYVLKVGFYDDLLKKDPSIMDKISAKLSGNSKFLQMLDDDTACKLMVYDVNNPRKYEVYWL